MEHANPQQSNRDRAEAPDRVAALEARLAALEAELAALRAGPTTGAEPAAPVAPARPLAPTTSPPEPPTSTRRAWLTAAGAAAAGAAAAAVAGASPAAAADLQPIYQAAYNDGTNITILRATYQKVLSVRDTLSGVSDYAATLNVHSTSGTSGIAVTAVQSYGTGVFTDVTHGTSYGASLNGGAGNLVLPASGVAGPSRAYSVPGAVVNDANGDLWMKVNSTQWRKLTGPSTAGSLHAITPVRIFDSRVAGWGGKFANETRDIDAKVKSAPLPAPASGIPAGVTSLLVNLAVTETSPGGYASLWAKGIGWPGNASINWSQPNLMLSNTTLTAVDANRIFQCKVDGSTHVVIDVIGYYR